MDFRQTLDFNFAVQSAQFEQLQFRERKKRKEKSQYILSFKKMQSKSGGGFINASFKDIDLLLAVERSIGELLERCLEVNKEPGAYNSRIKAAEGEALGDTAR